MKYIYTISDPITNNVFYVGATVNIEQRAKQHMSSSISYRCTETIQEIMEKGNLPLFTVLEIAYDDWRDIEKKWIYHFIEKGEPMLNKEMEWYNKQKLFSNCIIMLKNN